jgi:riboflavin transporter FmnP
MLAALAYVLMFSIRLPVMPVPPYLKYEPKDVIIVIAGFLYGPLSAFSVSAVVSTVEMFTVSQDGYWGLLMNILSSSAFACTASAIYRWRRSLPGAVIGLVIGVVFATGVMLLWNYLVVPIYVGAPREFVATMLVPYFLPFNLLKYGLNAGFTVLLYKPVRLALTQARMFPSPGGDSGRGMKINTGVLVVSVFVIATCILLIMAHRGTI